MIKTKAEWPGETARDHSTSQTTARRPRGQGRQNIIKDPVDPPYPRHRSLILGAHPPCADSLGRRERPGAKVHSVRSCLWPGSAPSSRYCGAQLRNERSRCRPCRWYRLLSANSTTCLCSCVCDIGILRRPRLVGCRSGIPTVCNKSASILVKYEPVSLTLSSAARLAPSASS